MLLKGDSAAKVEKNKPVKKNLSLLTKKAAEEHEASQRGKDYIDTLPNEVIHTHEDDGAMITNFEVDFKEEEEITMSSGIRGIRALRAQRGLIQEKIAVEPAEGKNRFAQYEERKN